MSILFIIGNGFDSAHGLPTSYNYFDDYLSLKFPESCNTAYEVPCENYLLDEFSYYSEIDAISFLRTVITNTEGNNWSMLEDALGRLNFDDYIKFLSLNNEKVNEWEISSYNEMVADSMVQPILAINDLFPDWINSIKIDKSITKISMVEQLLQKPHIILSFNYTDTMEIVYNEKNVFHIHGHQGSNIIFGHGEEECEPEDFEANYPGAEMALSTIYNGLKKSTEKILNKKQTVDFLNSITSAVDQVYSYGFSYGDVDLPYIEAICKKLNTQNVVWNFNDYSSKDEIDNFKSKLKNCGFKGTFSLFHA